MTMNVGISGKVSYSNEERTKKEILAAITEIENFSMGKSNKVIWNKMWRNIKKIISEIFKEYFEENISGMSQLPITERKKAEREDESVITIHGEPAQQVEMGGGEFGKFTGSMFRALTEVPEGTPGSIRELFRSEEGSSLRWGIDSDKFVEWCSNLQSWKDSFTDENTGTTYDNPYSNVPYPEAFEEIYNLSLIPDIRYRGLGGLILEELELSFIKAAEKSMRKARFDDPTF